MKERDPVTIMARPRGIRPQIVSRRAEQEENVTESALTKQPLLESEAQLAALPDPILTNDSSSEVDHPDDNNPPRGVPEDSEIEGSTRIRV